MQLTVDILNGLSCSINQDNLEQDVIVMDLSNCFSIDRVRVPSQLVNFLVNITLDLTHKVRSLNATRTHLFRDIKISNSLILTLELSEYDFLIWLSH